MNNQSGNNLNKGSASQQAHPSVSSSIALFSWIFFALFVILGSLGDSGGTFEALGDLSLLVAIVSTIIAMFKAIMTKPSGNGIVIKGDNKGVVIGRDNHGSPHIGNNNGSIHTSRIDAAPLSSVNVAQGSINDQKTVAYPGGLARALQDMESFFSTTDASTNDKKYASLLIARARAEADANSPDKSTLLEHLKGIVDLAKSTGEVTVLAKQALDYIASLVT